MHHPTASANVSGCRRSTTTITACSASRRTLATRTLRRAWRRLALEWHPDRAGVGTTATFQRISIAYAVISDPVARAVYDKRRGISRAPKPAPPPDAPIGRRAPGVLLQRISGPLNILLARGVVRESDDKIYELLLDAHEISEGGMVTISMRVPVTCDACAANPSAPCAVCGDTRVVEDLFAAWLAVRPGVADGTILTPSARLPGMVEQVLFRVRHPV